MPLPFPPVLPIQRAAETLGRSAPDSCPPLQVFLHLAETESETEGQSVSEPLAAVTRTVLEQRASLGSGGQDRSSLHYHKTANSPNGAGGGGDKASESIPLSDLRPVTSDAPVVPLQPSWQRAMAALIRIRLLTFVRIPAAIFFILIMPAGFMIGGLMINKGSSGSSSGPESVTLCPDLYRDLSLLYHTDSGAPLDAEVIRGWAVPADRFNGSYTAMLNDSVLAGLNVTSAGEVSAVLHDQALHSPAVVLNAVNNGRLR